MSSWWKAARSLLGYAVGGHELASGAQYPSHFGEQAILQFSRWHMIPRLAELPGLVDGLPGAPGT
jgi:hypothetical protein